MSARPIVPLAVMGFVVVSIIMLVVWAGDRSPAAEEDVDVRATVVHGPSGTTFHDGPLALNAPRATALGVLEAAAVAGNFTYTITGEYWEPFVLAVGPYENDGLCGWVFDVNGVRSPSGAESTVVSDGDLVEWYWDCDS